MRRLVFLDFDGVIMTGRSYAAADVDVRAAMAHRDTDIKQIVAEARMDPELVARVSTLCVRAGADIVLSTSWRGSGDEDRAILETALWRRGLDPRVPVVGSTPHGELDVDDRPGRTGQLIRVPCARGREIEQWLDTNRPGWREFRDRIVILDDDSDMEPLMDRWVRGCTFSRGGFTAAALAAALELFGVAP